MRLDKYLKVSRLIKRRTVANEACDAGRVSVNGRTAKAGTDIKPDDEIAVVFGRQDCEDKSFVCGGDRKEGGSPEMYEYI